MPELEDLTYPQKSECMTEPQSIVDYVRRRLRDDPAQAVKLCEELDDARILLDELARLPIAERTVALEFGKAIRGIITSSQDQERFHS